MKMTLAEVNIRNGVLNAVANLKLPYKLTKAVTQNLMEFQTDLKLMEENRIDIIGRYAEKNEAGELIIEGNHYKLSEESEAKFQTEYNEFLTNTETEVDVHTVSETVLEQLAESRYDALTPAHRLALDFMIEE